VPQGASNLVCTTFVAEALLDYHEATGQERWLEMALSAAKYIVEELYWAKDGVHSFSYPFPTSRVPVHNANLLASALLCRLRPHSEKFEEIALKVARYSTSRQAMDGSWSYGEGSTQGWIDNFHTGFNLCALSRIGNHVPTGEFKPHLARGFEFYRQNFFESDGGPKYFHQAAQPFDVHSAAQSLITLVELRELSAESSGLARKVLDWTVENLWSPEGFFYYQKRSWGRIKIPYMRWGQAWMLLALATVLEGAQSANESSEHSAVGARLELSGAI
jgi:hypothetical protein